MHEQMISINSETNIKEYIDLVSRINCFSKILSKIHMQRAEIIFFKSSLSSIDFEFLAPIYKGFQLSSELTKNKKNTKHSEGIDEETQFIIQLYETIENKPNKKTKIKGKCPIEMNYSYSNGIKSCKINIAVVYAVNNIIISILNQSNKSNLINKINQLKCQKTSSSVDEFEWEGKKSNFNYLDQLFHLDHVEICFSNYRIDNYLPEDKSQLYNAIIFFFYFFPFIFERLSSVTIDFNIYQLLNYYRESKDPYNFFVHEMEEGGMTYDYLFLANFLSAMKLKELNELSILKIIFNESYIIESQSLKRNKDSIFYLELFHLNIQKELDIAFNSLDPLLFQRSIDLILINKSIQHLTLDFFPQKPASFRKMCYNALFYNRLINRNDQNFLNPESAEDQYIDYVHLKELTISDKSIITDDKLVKYVFKGFNSYLKQLSYVLEIITETLESLSLNLNLYSELIYYDSYNSAVALFLYDLFLLLNYKIKDKKIEKLSIACNADNYETLISNIMTDNQLTNKLGLDLPQLKYIYLSLPNIRVYLSFSKFSFETIETMILNKMSFEDFTELVKAMKESQSKMNKANTIEISLNYSNNIDYNIIGDFINSCLPVNLSSLQFEIPFSLSIENVHQLIIRNILLSTKKNNNNKVNITLFVSITELRQFEGNKHETATKALEYLKDFFKNKYKQIGDYTISLIKYYLFKLAFNRIGKNSNNYAIIKSMSNLFNNKIEDEKKRKSILKQVLSFVKSQTVLFNINLKSRNEINQMNRNVKNR